MPEETTDNEFYVVFWEDPEFGISCHENIHLRYGETVFQHMLRVYGISADKIQQIYKRIYVK